MPRRACPVLTGVLSLAVTVALPAQGRLASGTLVIATAREAQSPVPTLFRNDNSNREISDLVFLRLADLGRTLSTTDERSFIPRLARRWERRDDRTVVFELDPRAHWHDGAPVTAEDAVVTFARARNSELDPQLALLLRRIESVTAEGSTRVVFRFTSPYPEQLYDATYHVPLLPAHLIGRIAPESLSTSSFMRQPIGSGPYRWSRRVPGQLIELEANPDFFLGRPSIRRIIFLAAGDAEARVNLVLSGEADALDRVYEYQNPTRLTTLPSFRQVSSPSLFLTYINFNQRDPADTSRPHPILGDPVVRRALSQAVDRNRIASSVYGVRAKVPEAPLSQLLAANLPPVQRWRFDPGEARRQLAGRGWRDSDRDGTFDRNGRPLALTMIVPATSATRRAMAQQLQEQWRQFGVSLELLTLEPAAYIARRRAGQFDLEFWSVTQDPTPSGLSQSWSCAGIGGSNAARYCNPAVDSLLDRAITARGNPRELWGEAAQIIHQDAPALFMVSPDAVALVHRRFTGVELQPDSPWALAWRWRLAPGQALQRDRN